jgi:hypothetical protein
MFWSLSLAYNEVGLYVEKGKRLFVCVNDGVRNQKVCVCVCVNEKEILGMQREREKIRHAH